MAKRLASHSFKIALLASITALSTLSGCNKLGYGEIRTAPEGQATLGPKRMPPLNQAAMQAAPKNQPQQPMMQQQQQRMPYPQQQPAMVQQPMMQPQQQQPAMMQPQMMQPQQQQAAPMQQAPQEPMMTPYGGGSQSYQPVAAPAPQSSYSLPQEFSPGSYYSAEPDVYQNPAQTGLARTVSATDYYSQDMSSAPMQQPMLSPAQMIHSEQYPAQPYPAQPYPAQQRQVDEQWYAPSAPVSQVQGRNLPMSAPGTYNAGYGMDAAYGRYQEAPVAVMPVEPSFYQPMNAKHAANYPAIDPYSPEAGEPQYNNFYYGGQGMPQGQNPNFAPNFQAAEQDRAMTNGFQGRASDMYNPVGQQSYVEETIRRPLEEPPMLARETMFPNPNGHAQPYYGDGQYR